MAPKVGIPATWRTPPAASDLAFIEVAQPGPPASSASRPRASARDGPTAYRAGACAEAPAVSSFATVKAHDLPLLVAVRTARSLQRRADDAGGSLPKAGSRRVARVRVSSFGERFPRCSPGQARYPGQAPVAFAQSAPAPGGCMDRLRGARRARHARRPPSSRIVRFPLLLAVQFAWSVAAEAVRFTLRGPLRQTRC